MNTADHAPLVAIAMLAARADGATGPAEQAAVASLVARIGSPDVSRLADQIAGGQVRAADLAARLSDDEARRLAYQAALAVCHADGAVNPAEQQFLAQLKSALGLPDDVAAALDRSAGALSSAAVDVGTWPRDTGKLDDFILQQSILTGALEVLPDSLATVAILPLQLRMVYQIGQKHGQPLDAAQIKDLAATLGIGAAAQAVEGVMIKVLGGLAGGLLGGLMGGATRIAAGAAVTFAATYALGHVADQYYAQNRQLSPADLKTLFARFQDDAKTIYPRVQQQVSQQASSLNLQSLLGGLRA